MTSFRVNEPQVIHQTVDDETVIVDLGSGSYYSLRGSAQAIWSALERGLDHDGVVDELGGRYEAERSDLASSVEGFVARLVDDRLIVPLNGSPRPATAGSAMPGDRQPFEPPVIERFDDLQDLILLDPVHEVSEEAGWPHARPTDGG